VGGWACERERKRGREGESMYVCVYVCIRLGHDIKPRYR